VLRWAENLVIVLSIVLTRVLPTAKNILDNENVTASGHPTPPRPSNATTEESKVSARTPSVPKVKKGRLECTQFKEVPSYLAIIYLQCKGFRFVLPHVPHSFMAIACRPDTACTASAASSHTILQRIESGSRSSELERSRNALTVWHP
jgi:hypothetical protein